MHTQRLVRFPESCLLSAQNFAPFRCLPPKLGSFPLSVSGAASGLIVSNGHQRVIRQSRTLAHPGARLVGMVSVRAHCCLCVRRCVCV